MILEVLIFGMIALWLLAVIPAAIVTLLKGQWLLFGFGWLTLGILWFVGAASLATSGSPWAKRLYDDEKLARAENPLRYPRRWRNVGLAVAGAIALILVLGSFAARPTPILGVGGRSLASSVGNDIPGYGAQSCKRLRNDAWSCPRWDDQRSGTVSYRVQVDGLGCWHAIRFGSPGEGSDKRLSGCVTIIDYFLG